MRIQPLSPSIGALIHGLDLSRPLAADQLAELRTVWLDRQVIIIREQDLSAEQYLAFARQLGTPDTYPFLDGLDGFPEITPVLKRETETVNFGGIWHSDTTYQPCPPMATMLYALELPPVGGDTLFANQYMAYETLSEGLKQTLDSLKIVCRADKADVTATRADRVAESGREANKEELVGVLVPLQSPFAFNRFAAAKLDWKTLRFLKSGFTNDALLRLTLLLWSCLLSS